MTYRADEPIRVLVVDDHRDSAYLTTKILRDEGYFVVTALCCDDAIDVARAVKVDVVISDIGLPECDGCQMLGEIKAMYPVKAVAFTAYPIHRIRTRYEKAGFKVFLSKPAEIAQIRDAVAKAAE